MNCLQNVPQIFFDQLVAAGVEDDHIPFLQRGEKVSTAPKTPMTFICTLKSFIFGTTKPPKRYILCIKAQKTTARCPQRDIDSTNHSNFCKQRGGTREGGQRYSLSSPIPSEGNVVESPIVKGTKHPILSRRRFKLPYRRTMPIPHYRRRSAPHDSRTISECMAHAGR